MSSQEWIDARTACALLGVKSQTLYAYVSRKQIRAQADTIDARRSLYAKTDVENMVRQRARPRARAEVARAAVRWGDPILATSISEIRDGMLWYRGHTIETCAASFSFEETVALLCGVDNIECPFVPATLAGNTALGRTMHGIATKSEDAANLSAQSPEQISKEGGELISLAANALLDCALDGPIHQRVCTAWDLDPSHEDMIQRILIIMSDHELNPSTFAVRVCASTGASLPAALLAGLTTLSGPRHGGVSDLANRALAAALEGRFPHFQRANSNLAPYGYGFGHPLYPKGDPRAHYLLQRLPKDAPEARAVSDISTHLGIAPNVDAALAAVSAHFRYPPETGKILFALGRLSGWIAHAIEQSQSNEVIRPRARFTPNASLMSD